MQQLSAVSAGSAACPPSQPLDPARILTRMRTLLASTFVVIGHACSSPDGQAGSLGAHKLGLQGHKLVRGHRAVPRQVHQASVGAGCQVRLHPVGQHVGHLPGQLLQPGQPLQAQWKVVGVWNSGWRVIRHQPCRVAECGQRRWQCLPDACGWVQPSKSSCSPQGGECSQKCKLAVHPTDQCMALAG